MCEVLRGAGESAERTERERERTTAIEQVVRLWILGICGLSSFPTKPSLNYALNRSREALTHLAVR